ncbi:TPA: restriction endonuclease subunit S [Streptococcus suis]|uniref:restriction endonuclease subunit S n=1 Tax=Streptococcus suis TaxID=1307 RepID=UPI002A7E6768|nr:restriction endonuclease subunit S [Streptococcus suis]MDY7593914.1 restriction endonuclease subunit S [Streptococcus suis]HEL2139487.1 restriction endonuclease subunit S [Streptococcus suis]HEL2251811.1 restriction endonuclease subunit S [Streptococcus suis]HEL2437323.1 restriction endonuclease subunit S [Streptococcus suis]HEM4387878.1 restriction endonuclease subunit S [Streptococcus suis]
MNHIEKMLQDYCPNGVEWKELGEVLDYEQPTKYIVNSKDYNEEYPIPVLTAGQTFILGHTNETEGVYAASKEKPIIIFDDFTTASKWVDFEFKVKSSAMKILTIQNEQVSKVLIRYVWHYLGTITYKPAQHGRQWIGTYSKIKIPIPPLKIQEEIVQILDKFTEYVTELTAELTLRQKQYNYFRDYLLNFDSDSSGGANNKVYQVEWKMLKDIAKLKNGKDWKSLSVGDVPVYGSGGAMGEFVSEYAYNKPTVLIPRKGSISNLFYLEKPFWNVDTIYYTEIDESQLVPRYLYYYLATIDLESMATNPTRPSLTQAILDKIPIPVPSLPIQQRIVQVLDNFDAVCNDLNIGLPKEIELRQKQYDYYREKLLTFTAEGVYTDSTVQYRQDLIRLLNWVFGPIRVELGAVASYGNQKISTGDLSPKSYIGVDNLLQNRAGKLDATYLPEMVKVNIYEEGNILIGNIRPYLKKIWFATNSGGASPDVLVVQNQVKDCLVNRYLYHILANDRFFEFDMQNAKGSKMPRGDKGAVLHYQFILPTFSDQFRIVAILDKFDELTTSISHGLPKEIELRQKQYEYFRDKLLTF